MAEQYLLLRGFPRSHCCVCLEKEKEEKRVGRKTLQQQQSLCVYEEHKQTSWTVPLHPKHRGGGDLGKSHRDLGLSALMCPWEQQGVGEDEECEGLTRGAPRPREKIFFFFLLVVIFSLLPKIVIH